MAMSGTKFYVTFLSVLVPCILRQFYLLEIVEVVLREIVFVVFLCCSCCLFFSSFFVVNCCCYYCDLFRGMLNVIFSSQK